MTNLSIKRDQKKNLVMAAKYALAAFLIIFAVLPFFWIVATSLNPAKSLLGARLLPKSFTLGNYTDLLGSQTLNYSRWFLNSLKVTAISMAIILVLTCIAGYALSRFKFRSKKYLMTGIMIINVFPGILAMIAIYSMLQSLGNYIPAIGLNTHGGLICIYVTASMSINVLMMKAYIDTVPMEIDESAQVEGATYWQTFWKVVFPMIRPMVVTIAILTFMAIYGDFIIANILLKGNDNITVMVGIFQFTQQRFDTDWGIVMAGTVIAALPPLAIFFISQKHIIDGLTSGAVKQ